VKANKNYKQFRKYFFKFDIIYNFTKKYIWLRVYFNISGFRQMLRELIPGDLIKIQSANDWKRSIIAAYNQDAGE
jgi:hypothetical protein